ncbi:MAG TPA: hypothetical protein VFI61_03150 [Patescibacteria group bacterium]|nr:hypothetical protein [Patescibacteria group bacterium]
MSQDRFRYITNADELTLGNVVFAFLDYSILGKYIRIGKLNEDGKTVVVKGETVTPDNLDPNAKPGKKVIVYKK